ncbi:uncharacterized protein LOC126379467 [Pectinophora gossypiella]|uniref:uncharacterized protein LOC126379467 n=1 Tax=Pectinophora gossypiella TaxID=13191 RepID=UPI00214F08C3|nr:uncharacterized protein LOC126379467 [Pectinophora gossypiella]
MTEDCKIFTSDFIRHMTPDQSKMLLPKLTKRKCALPRVACPAKRPVTEQLSADQPLPRHRRVAQNCSAYNTNEGMSGHLKYGVFRTAHNRTKRSERMQPAYRCPVSRVPVTPEHLHIRERGREREEKEFTRIQPRLWRRVGEQGNQKPKDAPLLVFRAIEETHHKHLHRSSVMHLDIRPRVSDTHQPPSRLNSPRIIAHGNRRLIHCQSHMSPLSPNRIFSPTYRNLSSDVLSSCFDSPKPNYLLPPMQQDRRGQRMSPPSFWNAALGNRLPSSRNSSNARTFSPDFELSRRDAFSPYRFQPNREPSFTRTFSRSKGVQREIRHKTGPCNAANHINRLDPKSVNREHSYRSVRLKNWLSNVAGINLEAHNYKPILNQKLSKPKFHSRTASYMTHRGTPTQDESAKRVRNAHTLQARSASKSVQKTVQGHEGVHECEVHRKPASRGSFLRSTSCRRISSGTNDRTSNRTFLTCTCSVSPTLDTTSVRKSRSKSLSSSYRTVSPELIPPEKVSKKGIIGFARSHIVCATTESCCQTY